MRPDVLHRQSRHNLAISVKLAHDAAAAGATALFLPEASEYIANDFHVGYLLAEPLATHRYTLGLQAIAKELGIHINAGIHERPRLDEAISTEPGSERVFNTPFYRKLHLFDIQLKEMDEAQAIPHEKLPRTGEHKKIIPGSVIPELICYDIRFPELHIILRNGADIITLPSAFTVYVIASAQAGAHSPQRSSWGEALLGRLPSIDEVDDPTQPLPPQFILADVDLARVYAREQIPLDIQKRDAVYGVVGTNTAHLAGVQSLFGYGSVRLPTAPSTETVVAAAGAGKQYY
ncbi:carbon-nitrogen hydrolase [Mycena olivaceomarginata]|nr:carbon-nitrogen hydrolase [Mycena olivaceomarginata]